MTICPHCGNPSSTPGKLGLTPKQQAALDAIKSLIVFDGCAPSYDQIAEIIGVKSKSTVMRLVSSLEARGHVRRAPNKARSIQIVGDAA